MVYIVNVIIVRVGVLNRVPLEVRIAIAIFHINLGYRFADSQGKTQVQHSQWKEERIDQPTESIIWLNLFRSMNENFLLQVHR